MLEDEKGRNGQQGQSSQAGRSGSAVERSAGGSRQQKHAARRSGGGQRGPVILLGALIACAVVVLISLEAGKPKRPSGPIRPFAGTGPPGTSWEHLDGETLGSPDAEVQVVAILSLRGGSATPRVGYLQSTALECGDKLYVKFFDAGGQTGQEEMKRHGLDSPGVVINGKTAFEISTPEGKKTVNLVGRPRQGYRLTDLSAALQQELDGAYGANAPKLPAPPPM